MLMFGTTVQGKTESCSLNGLPPIPIKGETFSLYVKVRNRCNCSCSFCEFTGDEENFDIKKFSEILENFSKNNIVLGKISFTGGEPTLDINLLEEIVSISRKYFPNSFITVNTNGVNLMALANINGVDSIALSRHHYDEEINKSIMGFSVSDSTIKSVISYLKLTNPHKARYFHFSCNLIKGYIDSGEELDKYILNAYRLGVTDVGFVTLMIANEYCKTNQVIFDDLVNTNNIIRNKYWKLGDSCRCANYLWRNPKDGSLSKFYSRYYCKGSSIGNLVYDGLNLKEGFSGPIIY